MAAGLVAFAIMFGMCSARLNFAIPWSALISLCVTLSVDPALPYSLIRVADAEDHRDRGRSSRARHKACCGAEPMVRIHLPPADSPSLAGFLLAVSKSRQLPRGARARPGGTAGRDAQGSSKSRQLRVTSLPGPIPVPQCQRGGSRPWLHWCTKRGRVSNVTGSGKAEHGPLLGPAKWQT